MASWSRNVHIPSQRADRAYRREASRVGTDTHLVPNSTYRKRRRSDDFSGDLSDVPKQMDVVASSRPPEPTKLRLPSVTAANSITVSSPTKPALKRARIDPPSERQFHAWVPFDPAEETQVEPPGVDAKNGIWQPLIVASDEYGRIWMRVASGEERSFFTDKEVPTLVRALAVPPFFKGCWAIVAGHVASRRLWLELVRRKPKLSVAQDNKATSSGFSEAEDIRRNATIPAPVPDEEPYSRQAPTIETRTSVPSSVPFVLPSSSRPVLHPPGSALDDYPALSLADALRKRPVISAATPWASNMPQPQSVPQRHEQVFPLFPSTRAPVAEPPRSDHHRFRQSIIDAQAPSERESRLVGRGMPIVIGLSCSEPNDILPRPLAGVFAAHWLTYMPLFVFGTGEGSLDSYVKQNIRVEKGVLRCGSILPEHEFFLERGFFRTALNRFINAVNLHCRDNVRRVRWNMYKTQVEAAVSLAREPQLEIIKDVIHRRTILGNTPFDPVQVSERTVREAQYVWDDIKSGVFDCQPLFLPGQMRAPLSFVDPQSLTRFARVIPSFLPHAVALPPSTVGPNAFLPPRPYDLQPPPMAHPQYFSPAPSLSHEQYHQCMQSPALLHGPPHWPASHPPLWPAPVHQDAQWESDEEGSNASTSSSLAP